MYKKVNKRMHTLLGLILFLTLFFVSLLSYKEVYADTLSDTITIEQRISINSPYAKPKDSFSYVIESLSEDSSLVKKFNLKGDSKKYLDIDYEKPGEYSYKLYQEKTDIENVSLDTEVYYIYVKITESDGKLVKDLVMIRNSSGKKVKDIVFNNRYQIDNKGSEGGIANPNQKAASKTSKNVKTGVESFIIPCLVLILSLISILVAMDKNSIKE